LGLSISREISRLLGGEIKLMSVPGEGSTFTLFIPQNYIVAAAPEAKAAAPAVTVQSPELNGKANGHAVPENQVTIIPKVRDDRESIQSGDKVLLIIEDNPEFASILLEISHSQGFKGIIALQGEEGMTLAQKYHPDAVTLDVVLPDVDGWSILDRLKHDPMLRHTPVQIVTGSGQRERGLRQGAFAFLQKPIEREKLLAAFGELKNFIDRRTKNLLVVEDNDIERKSIVELIGGVDIRTHAVGTGEEAISALSREAFDCLVLDLKLPDMDGMELLEKIGSKDGGRAVPIVVYTGRALDTKEEAQLKRFSKAVVVKGANSPEQLLRETTVFLHSPDSALSEPKKNMIQTAEKTSELAGKKVLIVDDDFRNIFAVSTMLEHYGMKIIYAENGRDGIAMLKKNKDTEVVLMDIMMPEMDGYETMRAIRKLEAYKSLPIIALTAKAMKGDRQKCIEAGATDYVTKPVRTDHLLSLLRVWLNDH
jgi:CheY-like chemotaxis protein